MKSTPSQPHPDDRAELARLLPDSVDRDLSSERHHRLQELVMSQIHQDLQTAERAPRRFPKRRIVALASALTAVAVAAVAIGIGGNGGAGGNGGPGHPYPGGGVVAPPPGAGARSGQQILLAAATTALAAPEGSGDYWYAKVVSDGGSLPVNAYEYEYWTKRDGRTWFRAEKSNGEVIELVDPVPFRLGATDITLEELRQLPTSPEALTAWITDSVANSGARYSGGLLTPELREVSVFGGLISLVSQLPAPPAVRAAAFRAIAAYPHVESLGEVEGGQGLLISLEQAQEDQARLVVDPATGQIRRTNFFVTSDGAWASAGEGGSFTLVSEWTNTLPS
ncbi:CU044_5270 family protein [Micromonospora sp. NPDC050417]|uniref:CU044_5270 family protein n=1 Tax=Micromonospora sp. NPDC050417 TaxID=3364280 RepID=UPI00379E69C7